MLRAAASALALSAAVVGAVRVAPGADPAFDEAVRLLLDETENASRPSSGEVAQRAAASSPPGSPRRAAAAGSHPDTPQSTAASDPPGTPKGTASDGTPQSPGSPKRAASIKPLGMRFLEQRLVHLSDPAMIALAKKYFPEMKFLQAPPVWRARISKQLVLLPESQVQTMLSLPFVDFIPAVCRELARGMTWQRTLRLRMPRELRSISEQLHLQHDAKDSSKTLFTRIAAAAMDNSSVAAELLNIFRGQGEGLDLQLDGPLPRLSEECPEIVTLEAIGDPRAHIIRKLYDLWQNGVWTPSLLAGARYSFRRTHECGNGIGYSCFEMVADILWRRLSHQQAEALAGASDNDFLIRVSNALVAHSKLMYLAHQALAGLPQGELVALHYKYTRTVLDEDKMIECLTQPLVDMSFQMVGRWQLSGQPVLKLIEDLLDLRGQLSVWIEPLRNKTPAELKGLSRNLGLPDVPGAQATVLQIVQAAAMDGAKLQDLKTLLGV